MRKRGRVDLEQSAVVKALRDIGVSVAVTSALGQGFPDLVWAAKGVTGMLELKTGDEKLTEAESKFHAKWGAFIPIVRTPEEAQRVVLALSLKGTA